MPELIRFTEKIDLTGYTLVIPSVSVGNVPQLTVDLIIKSFQLNKSASIWHPSIIPSVGCDPYNTEMSEICTECELYASTINKLAVIQLRSSLEYKLVLKFFIDIQKALSNFQLKDIIVLSSGFDYELKSVNTEKFYYITNHLSDNLMTINHVKSLPPNSGKYLINGGGFGTKLYEVLSSSFKCTLLLKYVSEGDNRPDACAVLEKLCNILGINSSISDISFPSSWQYVFGGPPPIGIY